MVLDGECFIKFKVRVLYSQESGLQAVKKLHELRQTQGEVQGLSPEELAQQLEGDLVKEFTLKYRLP